MGRGLAQKRFNDWRKAKRKKRIDLEKYPNSDIYPWYSNLHQYSKNKVHCSCPQCSAKTRNKGKRRQSAAGWTKSINYSISDLKKIEKLILDEDE